MAEGMQIQTRVFLGKFADVDEHSCVETRASSRSRIQVCIADGLDAAEKRTIGELWERRSGGKGLFLVVEARVGGRQPREQMLAKLDA
jgi:hypothetical protein